MKDLTIIYGVGQVGVAQDKEKASYWEKRYLNNTNKSQPVL